MIQDAKHSSCLNFILNNHKTFDSNLNFGGERLMFLHASVIFNMELISVQFNDGLCNTPDMTLIFCSNKMQELLCCRHVHAAKFIKG